MDEHLDADLAAIRARKLAELQRTAGAGAAQSRPIVVTDASFDAFVTAHPTVVVDCWAAWCPPCRAMAPIIDELAERWAGKVTFAKLDTDKNPRTAMEYNITSIPTLLIFQGGQFVDQVVGLPPKARLVQMLSPLAA